MQKKRDRHGTNAERNRTLFKKRTLSPKARVVLRAMLESDSVRGAARAAGVSPGLIYRLLKDDGFTDALEKGRSVAFDEALSKLRGSAGRAVDKLAAIVGMADIGEARRAATAILTLTLRSAELIEVEKRIAELERRLISERKK